MGNRGLRGHSEASVRASGASAYLNVVVVHPVDVEHGRDLVPPLAKLIITEEHVVARPRHVVPVVLGDDGIPS